MPTRESVSVWHFDLLVVMQVSGWAEKGVNAGAYSRVLVHEAREALMAGSGASPQAVMDQSQKNAKVTDSPRIPVLHVSPAPSAVLRFRARKF